MIEIKGPIFNDRCMHGEKNYIGSFSVVNLIGGKFKETKYDLYIYEDKTFGIEACIRYGNKGSQYISPGCIARLCSSEIETYRAAWSLLMRYGKIVYQRKEEV